MPDTSSSISRRVNRRVLVHSARTAVAAVVSLVVARALELPEGYWATITTLIIMQSALGAALAVSEQRFAGTALVAVMGALLTTYFGSNLIAFGLGVFVIGLNARRCVSKMRTGSPVLPWRLSCSLPTPNKRG